MAEFVLEAEPRAITGKKVKTLRQQGLVPITVYGPAIEPLALQVPYRPLEVCLMQAAGTNLIDVKVGEDVYPVLARDVQRDVLRFEIIHVDFLAVDESRPIMSQIPVRLVGQSPLVASRKGILLTGVNTISVKVLPSKLMNQIDVDLSRLTQYGESITIGDLEFEDGVEVLDDPDRMLARVMQSSAARAEAKAAETAVTRGGS